MADKYFIEATSFNGEDGRRTLDRALTILKLFKEYFIFSGVTYQYSNRHVDPLVHYQPFQRYTYDDNAYTVLENEENSFLNFWNDFYKAPYNTLYPFYRFHLADYRPYSIDCYVDHVASIESLLVPDGNDGKITKKFQKRGAYIINHESSANFRDCERYLRKAYDLRSDIVHGNKQMDKGVATKSRDDWKDDIKKIRNYNRMIIRYIIKNGLCDFEKRKSKMKTIFDQSQICCKP